MFNKSNNQTVTVYEPNQRQKIGFFKSLLIMFRNIRASRELIWQLFKRDFVAVYKKSFLGMGWLFISPVIGIISWVLMNATGILNPGDTGIPYPAYVLLSTSIWGLFMGFYGAAAGTLGAGGGFIMQVKYPHEALLMKQVAQHLAGFFIGFLMNIVVLLFFYVIPSWQIILFPIVALPLFFLGSGIGLIIAVINVVAVEIQRIVDAFFGFLIFLTPVIYAPNFSSPFLQSVLKWNPLTYLVGAVRDTIVYGRIDNFDKYLYASAFSLVVFIISWRLFYVSEEKVIEKMI
jgi:lipopolysaccharide transport system permease protein